MNKEELIKTIDTLMNNYDAYLFENKYLEDKNTHKKEFDLLIEYFKNDEMCMKAINWIKYRYDYFYKDEFENDENSAFAYLKSKLGE